MQKSYCMMCGEQKDGLEVENDRVLDAMRWFKRSVTRNEQNNRLVVCKDCYENYKKSRSRYESRQKLYLVLGVIFVVFGFILSQTLTTLFFSVMVLIFLYLLSLLSYTPHIDMNKLNKAKKRVR